MLPSSVLSCRAFMADVAPGVRFLLSTKPRRKRGAYSRDAPTPTKKISTRVLSCNLPFLCRFQNFTIWSGSLLQGLHA